MPILDDTLPRRTPEQYIQWVGGPMRALMNFTTLNSQCMPDFQIPPFWLQVKSLAEKALGQEKVSLKALRSEREMAFKIREARKKA